MKKRHFSLRLKILLSALGMVVAVASHPTVKLGVIRFRLALAGTPVYELHRGKPSLGVVVRLRGPEVAGIRPLTGLHIQHLELVDTKVSDLTPLSSSTLFSADLHGSPVTNLLPLAGTGVYSLNLLDTGVTNLEQLAQLENLHSVKLPRSLILQNLDLLKQLGLLVSDDASAGSALAGGIGWRIRYEGLRIDDEAEPVSGAVAGKLRRTD